MQNPRLNMRPELNIHYLVMSVNAQCSAHCLNCCGYVRDSIPPMKLEKVKEIIQACVIDGGIRYVFPSCTAEMTLHPDCVNIAKYLCSIQKPDLFMHQDTNARFIPDGFIEALNNAKNVYNLSVSLWGGNEKDFVYCQGEGDFNKTVENTKRYLAELKNPPQFSLPWVTKEQLTDALKLITKLIKDAGYKPLVLDKECRPSVMYANKLQGYVPICIRKFVAEEEKVNYQGKNVDFVNFNSCTMLYDRVVIHIDGSIKPCLRVNYYKEHSLGNIYDYDPFTYKDLVNILNSEKAQGYIKRNFTPGEFACPECKNCTTRIAY